MVKKVWVTGLPSPVAQQVKNLPTMQETHDVPGSWTFPAEANGNPLQYSWLKNYMNRGAWQAAVHGVEKTQTQLGN